MNAVHAIMVLIIRLWAAGVIINSIIGLSFWPLLAPSENGDGDRYATYTFISGGIWTAVGLLAWFVAPTVARLGFKDKTDKYTLESGLSANLLIMIGSFLIGGFYFVEYFPALVSRFSWVIFNSMKGDPNTAMPLSYHSMEQLITALSVVVVSFFLMLKPAQIAPIFSWIRSAGHYEEPEKEKIS